MAGGTTTSTFNITRTYATVEGGSAFDEVEVPLCNNNWIGALSDGTDVHEIVFRETSGSYDLDWHTAPCRQFIIMTQGGVDVTVSSGETRRLQTGDVLLVEDTHGQGHRSKAADGLPRKSILVKLRDDAPPFAPASAAKSTATYTQPAPSVEPCSVGMVTQQEEASGRCPEAPTGDALYQALQQAAAEFASRHPKSAAQHERATRSMPGGNTRTSLFTTPFPVTLAGGLGCHVTDIDGRQYIDGVGEFTAGIAGHSHPVIVEAVKQALESGINLGGHTETEILFAEELRRRFPSMRLLRFTNSGTEANLMAIMAARAFTQRPQVMAFKGGYHGSVFLFTHGAGDPVNAPFGYVISEYNDAAGAARLIQENADSLACVIVEGMLGSNGCIPATPSFMQTLRHETRQVGALLIMDEVMTSRLAIGGLQAKLGVTPDLTTLGKYLGGGLSFGAFGGRADVMAAFDPRRKDALRHAGTFNQNALTMAAGLAGTTQVFTVEALEALNARGDALRERLNEICRRHGAKLQWTGQGSMMMPHFVHGRLMSHTDTSQADPRLKQLLFLHLNKHGVWTNASCMINLCLPFSAAKEEALADAVDCFLTEHSSLICAVS